jgi:hypothetical protein
MRKKAPSGPSWTQRTRTQLWESVDNAQTLLDDGKIQPVVPPLPEAA